jgi:hypothetical protein
MTKDHVERKRTKHRRGGKNRKINRIGKESNEDVKQKKN